MASAWGGAWGTAFGESWSERAQPWNAWAAAWAAAWGPSWGSAPEHVPLPAPFPCPTKWELWHQVRALLPRGRAWQTHAAVVERVPDGLGGEVETLTVMGQYWAAYAEVLEYLHARACALIDEMFCSSARELKAEWGTEWGFPDDCEPFDTLCAKVQALGGSTCAYLAGLAARLGYAIECSECDPKIGFECGLSDIGCDPLTCCQPNVIIVRIITALSPSMGPPPVPFEAGSFELGCTPPCPPAPDQLVCLIERFKPAHVRAIYEVI